MENEKVAEKVAVALHPPKCPKCGKGLRFRIIKEDRDYEKIQYRCSRCGAVIANNVDDAEKFLEEFLKGEE